MTEQELRIALADRDWSSAVADATVVAREGDVDWVIVPLADGRWAATDDAEIDPDRVEIFPSRLAALAFQWAGWIARYPEYDPDHDDTPRFGWVWPSEWITATEVARRYGRADGSVVRMAIRKGRVHPAALRKITTRMWLIRAEEAERLWGRG